MRLGQPWALLLLLPVAAAVYWLLTGAERRRGRLPYPAAERLARAASAAAWPAARWAPAALRGAAMLLLVLGLARPQLLTSRMQQLGRGIDIMLVLDVSPSMAADDVEPTRVEAAKATAKRFIEGRVQDRIGLVVFGGASQLMCPLTLDYDALLGQLDTLAPGMTGVDGTAIGDGIVSALNHLRSGEAKTKIAILLTDGRSNTGVVDPVTAARTAAAAGVKVYTIGVGGRGPARVNYVDPTRGVVSGMVDDDLDEDLLDRVSQLTDARYFRAASLKQLQDVYSTIDKLEKSKITLPPIVSRDDRYRPLALAAALLLLAEAAACQTLWLRWP